jgi:Protein of unknown function (DUF3667)
MAQNLSEFQGTECLNCGTVLTGNYCIECGQRATDVNLSVQTLLVEFIESLFSLEFGFWQTFKRLVFFPGALTEEYISGRRKRYSSPVRLYIMTSLLFFFLIGFMDSDAVKVGLDNEDGGQTVYSGTEALDAVRGEFSDDDGSFSEAQLDSTLQATFGDIPGEERLSKLLQDPEAAKARFFTYLPRAMFLMVPLAALFFKLTYYRHKRPYLHYLVFALHLHALFYLTASVAGLLGRIQPESVGDSLAAVLMISFAINTVRGQRRAFGDGWRKAILKAGLVWHVYGFFLLLVIVGVSALTIFKA